MAELIVNPNEPIEGLTPEEQESLEIGERMQQEQEQLLAGKYRSPEELEKAYIELQKAYSAKNGEQLTEGNQSQGEESEEEESQEVDIAFLDKLWEEAVEGKYSEETIKSLQESDPTSLAQMYLQYRQQQEQANAPTLTEENATQLKQMVGGDEQYGSMMEWAGENLSQEEIQMFDNVMESGNALAAYWAVQALAFRYGDAVGRDGNLVTGRASRDPVDVFRSQAEVVRAMQDPRYDNDPAYRQDVFEKLERSNIPYS